MPTYDYECNECGHTFEHFQSMSSAKLRKCPSCGRMRLRRLIGSGAGVIFKGSGFYETDYKQKSRKSGSESGSDKSESESKSEPSDSKSDTETSSSASDTKSSDSGSESKASKPKKKTPKQKDA